MKRSFNASIDQGESSRSTAQGESSRSTAPGGFSKATVQGESARSTNQGESSKSTVQSKASRSTARRNTTTEPTQRRHSASPSAAARYSTRRREHKRRRAAQHDPQSSPRPRDHTMALALCLEALMTQDTLSQVCPMMEQWCEANMGTIFTTLMNESMSDFLRVALPAALEEALPRVLPGLLPDSAGADFDDRVERTVLARLDQDPLQGGFMRLLQQHLLSLLASTSEKKDFLTSDTLHTPRPYVRPKSRTIDPTLNIILTDEDILGGYCYLLMALEN
ncbi:MAG: hypothetical protein M1817_000300 [Caeruleum heppii]|nr:MAG: hypothetical protein M1817_000300 [Caeruleum heppii]